MDIKTLAIDNHYSNHLPNTGIYKNIAKVVITGNQNFRPVIPYNFDGHWMIEAEAEFLRKQKIDDIKRIDSIEYTPGACEPMNISEKDGEKRSAIDGYEITVKFN